ncbi:hypothetical protein F0U60_24415 [Archangium minus]|uniref:Lipoprotein n=1 Tax=Archangium minus TaxID=83450 RepID=A0ABY9WVE1_9BACT|nr:hypothetical protein F0U60_24415 [Archangium minus]
MRAAIIAGLMAAGLLVGCGGTSDGQEDISSDATVESAEPGVRTQRSTTFFCCDGTECFGTPRSCATYCSQNDLGGLCG